MLLLDVGHRHAAGDRQPVRMIGHAAEFVAAREACFHDLFERLHAVAERRMHLQIAAVLLDRNAVERRIAQHPADARPAHEVVAQPASLENRRRLRAICNETIDGRRLSGGQDLENDAFGFRSDVRDLSERPVRLGERLDRIVEPEHGFRRALVAHRALLRRLRRREVEQQRADHDIGVRRLFAQLVRTRATSIHLIIIAWGDAGSVTRLTT